MDKLVHNGVLLVRLYNLTSPSLKPTTEKLPSAEIADEVANVFEPVAVYCQIGVFTPTENFLTSE